MTRQLLIDGTNIFIQHYAVNPTTDMNGIPAGGVAGTLKAIRAMARTLKPTKVVFVWDGPKGSVNKRRLFSEYKKGRRSRVVVGRHYKFEDVSSAIENKKWQTVQLRKLLDHLPICQIVTESIEADDAIAYIVNQSKSFGHKSNIIATCDQDFYQLISDNTVIFNPASKKLITEKSLIESTGYHPSNWLFYKSINGDKSDNIDGIKGVGPKTIAKLFDVSNPDVKLKPESIKEIYTNCTDDKLKKKYKKIFDNLELIERNWKLMSLEEVMIDLNSRQKIFSIIENFIPIFNKVKFYVELQKLGGLGIPEYFFDEFHILKNQI